MKRSIYSKIMAVLIMVLLCTACGEDKSTQDPPAEQQMQTMEATIAAAAEEAASLEEALQNEPLDQMEMNETAGAIYTIWDDLLNDIWGMLQEELDDETMAKLKEEQLDWIVWKEDVVEAAGAEVEGGSMYPLVTNLKAAELTEERVYVLAEYLQ